MQGKASSFFFSSMMSRDVYQTDVPLVSDSKHVWCDSLIRSLRQVLRVACLRATSRSVPIPFPSDTTLRAQKTSLVLSLRVTVICVLCALFRSVQLRYRLLHCNAKPATADSSVFQLQRSLHHLHRQRSWCLRCCSMQKSRG